MSSVFIKVPVSERLPKESGLYITNKGVAHFISGCKRWARVDPLWYLEEIELPTEEEIRKAGLGNFTEDDINDVYGEFIEDDRSNFVKGANFILYKLKVGTK